MELDIRIAEATKELVIRELAAPNLKGIVALQNQSSIDRLYDVLNHLHIERIERLEASAL